MVYTQLPYSEEEIELLLRLRYNDQMLGIPWTTTHETYNEKVKDSRQRGLNGLKKKYEYEAPLRSPEKQRASSDVTNRTTSDLPKQTITPTQLPSEHSRSTGSVSKTLEHWAHLSVPGSNPHGFSDQGLDIPPFQPPSTDQPGPAFLDPMYYPLDSDLLWPGNEGNSGFLLQEVVQEPVWYEGDVETEPRRRG
ncbi:hypothetical protein BDV96DRAFT_661963 [Lophiotrema nucula]|uniref:Uncharacterized protein n=1 Tax=Lophiotrema nucula TaxID=690887 RepID=A0A6A5Z5W0_9PLEO|nr:hypothetical protein BDV96DRAFT_661963 [Lophiotrema nucula]